MFVANKVFNSLKNVLKSNVCSHRSAGSFLRVPKRHFSASQQTIEYNVVEPIYKITYPERVFPDSITKPHYADDGKPRKHYEGNLIKTFDQIKSIAEACRIAKTICMTVGEEIQPGMTCEQIDDRVYELCLKYNVYPSPLNYSGFPKCVTTSVNNIAVHAIPDQRPLCEGDIISVDVSVFQNGYHGDCCHTFAVGKCDLQAQHLMNVAELCLYEAIQICKAGTKLRDIGEVIERIAKEYEMGVIPEFCGHGVGQDLHEAPSILHYRNAGSEQVMLENMIFTIEPIISESIDPDLTFYDDGWTVGTQDLSRTAQYEHTIWVRKDRSIILTSIDP